MFRKSQNNQGNLFSSISNQISSRKQKLLDDPSSWHHVFYKEIVSRLDEEVYSVLFCENNGRPNASLRVLVGMMILKEGNGWSDEQLFEECRFNIKVMLALGYMNLDEDVPVESTYYAFRKLLSVHNEAHGTDLVKQSFHQITKEQVSSYEVSGRKIRLDSKLINSNIAVCTRLDLVLEAVRKFTKRLDVSRVESQVESKMYKLLLDLQKKSTTNLTYSLSKVEKEELLKDLGKVIKVLLDNYKGKADYNHLERLYKDQYREVDKGTDTNDGDIKGGDPELKDAKELSSSSLQSIHDPDATFRTKGRGHSTQRINGYHANITETCDESNELNLIVDVRLDKANINEEEFLLDAIESSEQLLQSAKKIKIKEEEEEEEETGRIIEHATTDGGYDGKNNREKMAAPEMPHWNMEKNKGKKQRFQMSYDKDNNLQVIDKKSGQKCEVGRSRKGDKVVIKFPTDKAQNKMYYTDEAIKNYLLLQTISENLREEDRNIRANVEATIHQTFHRLLKRNKIKYRGQYKCNMYVLSRALWVNFRRIHKNVTQIAHFFMFLILSTVMRHHTTKLQAE